MLNTKSQLKKHFFFSAYSNIRNNLPGYVWSSIKKIIPMYLVSAIMDLIGLFLIFPVIRITIEPKIIKENFLINSIYSQLKFSSDIHFVLFLFGGLALVFAIKNIILLILTKKQSFLAFNLASKISYDQYSSYINNTYLFHTENNSAVLLRNFTQLPFELVSYMILPFIALFNEILILASIILALSLYDPILFLSVILFTIPFLFVYGLVYKKKLKKVSKRRDEESSMINKLGLQSMENFREIVVFDKKDYFGPIFKRNLESYAETNGSLYFFNSFSPKIIESVAFIGVFSVFLMGFFLDMNVAVLSQFLVVFSLAAYRVIPSLNKIILCSNYIKSSMYIFQYFNKEKVEESEESDTDIKGISFQSEIELRNLGFKYPQNEKMILKDLNLSIKRGEKIGVVGPSGSGKTSLLNILLRLTQETSGGIYVDGIRVTKANIKDWYKLVSYVPQNIMLLDGTVLENVAFGVKESEIDLKKLNDVIKQAQLLEFVSSLKKGIHTQIGERGVKISGGQRQRIGIARALYHGGKILIFDEATSALDIETEREITSAINRISKDEYTVIIVAHRIQTLVYCDSIYSLKEGKLVKEQS